MFLAVRIFIAFAATIVCIVPVVFVTGGLLFGLGLNVWSISHYGLLAIAAFAIVEIGARMRGGSFRLGDRISLGWVAVSASLSQVAGFTVEAWPPWAGALGSGFVGGLIATFVWSREPEPDEETGPRTVSPFRRTAGRFGIAILLALTLVGVAHAIGTILGWL